VLARFEDLTPAELSKGMVHKAVQVAPAISSAIGEKKPQGRKRQYAAPKEDIALALGVSKGTLVNAEQHVLAMERYPVLVGPEVSQKGLLPRPCEILLEEGIWGYNPLNRRLSPFFTHILLQHPLCSHGLERSVTMCSLGVTAPNGPRPSQWQCQGSRGTL
jgi:hypothetical protein